MASRPKKDELLARLAELGVEAPPKATNPELYKLVQEAEAAAKADEPADEQAGEPAAETRTVSCKGYHALNVRLGPSKHAPVVGELFHGDQVAVEPSDVDGWLKVDKGYSMEKYLV